MATIIPFRPFESVARQLRRFGSDDQRGVYFRRVHQQLAAGFNGKSVAGDVSAAMFEQRNAPLDGAA